MSICAIRIPLGDHLWRSSDDLPEYRALVQFFGPIFFGRINPGDRFQPADIETRAARIKRQFEFHFHAYRVSDKAALIKMTVRHISLPKPLTNPLVDTTIGGCEGDFLRVLDKFDVFIGFQNSIHAQTDQ